MTAKTEMDIALEALERIAEHEKECGERWAECTESYVNFVKLLRTMQHVGKN